VVAIARWQGHTEQLEDPDHYSPEDEAHDMAQEAWYDFWMNRSDGLACYLEQLKEIEAESITGNIENGKRHLMRRKMTGKRKLNAEYGCPLEPC